jgi:hypothetical protein
MKRRREEEEVDDEEEEQEERRRTFGEQKEMEDERFLDIRIWKRKVTEKRTVTMTADP